MLGSQHNRANILVGAGRFLGDAAGRGTADENALRGQIVLDLAPAPLLERGVARHGAAGAVAGRRKRLLLGGSLAHQNLRAGAHAAANQHRLADRAQRRRQALVAWAEGAGGALAMHEQLAPLAVD